MSWRNANTLTYDNKKLFKGRDKLNVLIGHEVSSSQRKSIENVSVAFPVTMNFDDMKANMGLGQSFSQPIYHCCKRKHIIILWSCELYDDG